MKKSKLISPSTGQCVWVDAGVISYRLCTLNYDCERCSLHHALVDGPVLVQADATPSTNRVEVGERRAEFDEFFKKLPATARKCRYMLTGDVSYKLCVDGFRCASCSFAQMMEDLPPVDRSLPADDSQALAGLRFSPGVHYHRGHTWVRVERDGNVRVGLDDFGQWLLGSVQHVRLPGAGEAVFDSVPACKFHIETGWIGVHPPISGKVVAVNQRLLEQPGSINDSAYTGGWLLMVQPFDLQSDLVNLLYGEEARNWLKGEIGRVYEKVKGERGRPNLVDLEKDSTWRKNLIDEMAGEFFLTKLKKAA